MAQPGERNDKNIEILHPIQGGLSPRRYTTAIVAAAGNSTRMQLPSSASKQLLSLDGIPVLAHTLLAYENASTIHDIILVGKVENFPDYRAIAAKYHISKLRVLCEGGKTRQESVLLGIKHVPKKVKYVAIADGARCLTTPQQIEAVCRSAYRTGAASAATKATDTVKLADMSGFAYQTQDRETVWLAQTPQVFSYLLYHAAAYYAVDQEFIATDDNSIVEFIGRKVKMIECGRENMKITTPIDVCIAEAILQSRKAAPINDKDE